MAQNLEGCHSSVCSASTAFAAGLTNSMALLTLQLCSDIDCCRHKPGRSVLSVFLAYRRRVRSRILIREAVAWSCPSASLLVCFRVCLSCISEISEVALGEADIAERRSTKSDLGRSQHSITRIGDVDEVSAAFLLGLSLFYLPESDRKKTHCEVWSHQSGRILLVMVFCDGGSNDGLEN